MGPRPNGVDLRFYTGLFCLTRGAAKAEPSNQPRVHLTIFVSVAKALKPLLGSLLLVRLRRPIMQPMRTGLIKWWQPAMGTTLPSCMDRQAMTNSSLARLRCLPVALARD